MRDAFSAALENVGWLTAILQHHQAAGRLRAEARMTAMVALIGPLMVQEMLRRADFGQRSPATDTPDHR